jgi:hypothetical protein
MANLKGTVKTPGKTFSFRFKTTKERIRDFKKTTKKSKR